MAAKTFLIAVVSVLIAGIGGYAAGALTAADSSDVREVKADAQKTGFTEAFRPARRAGQAEGRANGRRSGRQLGMRAGERAGSLAGQEEARARAAAEVPETDCPPGTTYVPRAVGEYMYPDGCVNEGNLKYYEPGVPTGDDYPDQIPNNPGIQGD